MNVSYVASRALVISTVQAFDLCILKAHQIGKCYWLIAHLKLTSDDTRTCVYRNTIQITNQPICSGCWNLIMLRNRTNSRSNQKQLNPLAEGERPRFEEHWGEHAARAFWSTASGKGRETGVTTACCCWSLPCRITRVDEPPSPGSRWTHVFRFWCFPCLSLKQPAAADGS